ncbi:hypothetical protein DY000_02016312 [Brassica cretica]|uniref:Uncharacterized protein n=1 Tax=Brassica cretica TaxID=69181 RepID=A0ABQ7CS45_BRACR|nr:hypothetical protein DY000_02016312 [Brassica cretica]
MTAYSHVLCCKQKRTRLLRSRDAVDFTGSEITIGCLIEHYTGTGSSKLEQTVSHATLKEPLPARREVGQVVAEEAAACQSRSPITGSQSRRGNRRNHEPPLSTSPL